MAREHKRLGDLLLEQQVITPDELAAAVTEQRKNGQLLGATLVRMGVVTEETIVRCLQRQLGLALLDLNDVGVDEQALALVKEDVAKKYGAIPIEVEGRST
ncbi:MAG: type II secretion system protein GspE, partial [Candidatus Eiseniibacteriota bacterium]